MKLTRKTQPLGNSKEDPKYIEKLIREDIETVNYLPWNVRALPVPDDVQERKQWMEAYSEYPEYSHYIRVGDRRDGVKQSDKTPLDRFYRFIDIREIIGEMIRISKQFDRGFVDGMPKVAFKTTSVISTWDDGHTIRLEYFDWAYWYNGLDVRRFRQCQKTNCRKCFWAKPLDKRFCSLKCQRAEAAKRSRAGT